MSYDPDPLTRQIPDTPAGRQLAWMVTMLARDGEGACVEDWDRHGPDMLKRFGEGEHTAERMREAMRSDAEHMGQLLELGVESASEFAIVALVRTAKNRKWAMNVTVEADPPHRIARSLYERRRDFKLEVREAGPADALVVADIERRCPMVMGDTSMWFDRGARYFDFSRLLPDSTVGLASVDGAPAAVSCGAVRLVRVGGELKRIMIVSHLRVLPEHQGKGLWSAANSALDKYRAHIDGTQAYVSVDNQAVLRGFQTTQNRWDQLVQRAELDCAGLAGPMVGRPASRADAAEIAGRLNAFHDAEELYVPYTAASFAARVERAPDLYGWDNVWLTDGIAMSAEQDASNSGQSRLPLGLGLFVLAGLAVVLTAWIFGRSIPASNIGHRAPAAPAAAATALLDAPQKFEPLTPEQAATINANVPISRGPNPAAAPFTMADSTPADRANALRCLTLAVYYEAATQPTDGQAAVAQVVLNRVRNAHYPKSVCGVVFQGSQLPTGCQFTFTCDGSLSRTPDAALWRRAGDVAQRALNGYVESAVGLATHYHTIWVVPYWQSTVLKVGQIGAHVFYRMEGGLGMPAAFSGRYVGAETIPPFVRLGFDLASPSLGASQAQVALPSVDKAVDTTLSLAEPVQAAGEVKQATVDKPQQIAEPTELSSRVEFFGGHEASATQRLPIASHW